MFQFQSTMRRIPLVRIAGAACALLSGGAWGQFSAPAENPWGNPDFVRSFLGSYAPLTEEEPQISSAEATLFQELADLLEGGDAAAGIQLVQNALRPESSAALDYTLGNLSLQAGQTERAAENYRTAIRKHPRFLRAYKNLGLALLQSSQFEEARDNLIRALELGDREGNTFGLVGYCYLNLGSPALARDTYAMARVLSPSNRDWTVGYAQSLMQTGEYEKAVPVFRELIQQQPGSTQYYSVLANAYISLEEYATASRYLEILRRMGEADAAAHGLLGDIYMNESLYGLALDTYLDAYDASGEVSDTRTLQVASAFVRRGAYDAASEFIAAFSENRSDNLSAEVRGELLNLRASIALAQGDSAEAARILEAVIADDPRNGRALLLLGDYYAGAGEDSTQASYYYDLAQNIQETRLDALTQQARLKVRQREYQEAIELLEEAQSERYQANVARYLDAIRRALEAGS